MCREAAGSVAAHRGFFYYRVVIFTYQALYRKWRPKTFSEVVGQSHITDTLRAQISEGHTAHAYLFTGTRGTGKTTCARILAKAINCLHPVDGEPCGICEACKAIDSGNLLDITEIDAASNNGVENVRSLREEAIFAPSVLKKRIYIIDEVHMLSIPAFNALLKIIEEPPEHLVFIMATTELHKVPATILSRCQRFSFKRMIPRDIEKQLLKIAEAESIDLKQDGAEILARMANGSMRDSLSLLDQCRASGVSLDSQAILDSLGLAGSIQSIQMMRCILAENTSDAMMLFDQLYQNGKDIAALLGELSDLSREIAMLKAAPSGASTLLTGIYDRKTLDELGASHPLRRFISIATQLQSCISVLGSSSHPRTDAEICILRLCDVSLSGDFTALEDRVRRLEITVSEGISATSVQKPMIKNERSEFPRYDTVPAKENTPSSPKSPVQHYNKAENVQTKTGASAETESHESVLSSGGFSWAQFLDYYKGQLRVDKRVFLNMTKGTLAEDCLCIHCPSELTKNSLDDPEVIRVLQEVTSEKTGKKIRVRFTTDESSSNLSFSSVPRQSENKQTVSATQPVIETSAVASASSVQKDQMNDIIQAGKQLSGFKII